MLGLWIVAPWLAFVLSRPTPTRRAPLTLADREYLLEVAGKTWAYFDAFVGDDDHGLPPDNVQVGSELIIAHRTSPTNIGLGLLATLAAHDLGFIEVPELVRRIDATLTTIERLAGFEGHLLNWYDTRTLEPLPPAYVSTVDSGNLAGALLTLSVGLRDISPSLSTRAAALFDAMNFRFLFDPKRQLFAIGYRLADAENAGRLDASYYDLLASEARLASFIAIAKGDVPEMHWFHLGRSITSVQGRTGAALVERDAVRVPDAAAGHADLSRTRCSTNRAAWRSAGRSTTRLRGACRGASRSRPTTSSIDMAPISTRRSASPGSGLKRGLGDEVVVAPYATALAVMIDPAASTANLRRLAAAGLEGEYGFFDAIDYTHRGPRTLPTRAPVPHGVIVSDLHGASPGHDARRTDQCAAWQPHDRTVPRRAESPGHRTAAAGACAARRADDRTAAARRNARRRRLPHQRRCGATARRTRRSRTRSSSRTDITSRR